MPMKINVDTATDFERVRLRARNDLLRVYNSKSYINEKGYLTKLIDLLYELDYYQDNESLFLNQEGSLYDSYSRFVWICNRLNWH